MGSPALYPYATQRLLYPEAHREPVITPCLAIFHTHGFRGSSEAVGNHFDKESVGVESHVSVKLDGRVIQFMPFDRQADATGGGNGFRRGGRLYGAHSYEAEDNPAYGNPYTQAQVTSLGMLLAWDHLHWGIPLYRAGSWDGDGVGWHSLFLQWNPNKHACPGTRRVQQIPEVVDVARWFVALAHREQNLTDVVDSVQYLGARWDLQRDGGVITHGGAPFLGSFPGLPPEQRQGVHRFGSIESVYGGYVLTDTCPEQHRYHFPPAGQVAA